MASAGAETFCFANWRISSFSIAEMGQRRAIRVEAYFCYWLTRVLQKLAKDFGSPSALGLQIYAGTRDPFVNAKVGRAVRPARTNVLKCMMLGLLV